MESSRSKTLRLKAPAHQAKALPADIKPTRIDWGEGNAPATIHFSDGLHSPGSCIRCIHPPCIEYDAAELELEAFKDFPADRNNSVCPTDAITWAKNNSSPIIESNKCISCGICVSRCPTRAIFVDSQGAHINDEPNQHFQLQSYRTTEDIITAVADHFNGITEQGVYRSESDAAFQHIFIQIKEIAKKQGPQFPNHLARNLLIACGIGAAMRRRGDTNIRMDMLLGSPGVMYGTSEVEFGEGVLEAPRNILDNVAVLASRYQINKEEIVPLIVCLALPNQRSEYWQVIKDIRSVLQVKINSVTIGLLVLFVWNRMKIVINTGEELYIDSENTSLRPVVEQQHLERPIKLTRGYPGLLESEK